MRRKLTIQQLTLVSMFAAVIAILSQLSIPMPSGIPITLQTFAVALAGYVLGAQAGTGAVLVWLLLGIAGVPVFSNFRSGIGQFFGYTGGFLIGFPFMTCLCGIGRQQKKLPGLLLGLAGLVILHTFGILGYARVAQVSIGAAAFAVSIPYIIKDMLSVVIACKVGEEICKRLR